MRTNKFIPLLIALFIHAIPLLYLVSNKTDSAMSSPHSSLSQGIDLSGFSIAKRNSTSKRFSEPKAINPTVASVASVNSSNIEGSGTTGGSTGGPSTTSGNGVVFVQMREPQYPPIARQKGLEGKVKVKAFYNNEGIITKVDIMESSGVKMLDESVSKTVSEWKLSQGSSGSFEKSFEFKLKN